MAIKKETVFKFNVQKMHLYLNNLNQLQHAFKKISLFKIHQLNYVCYLFFLFQCN